MSDIMLGFWCVHDRALHDLETAREVARILTDARWPWLPSLVGAMQRPGQPVYTWRKGRIPAAELGATVTDIMASSLTVGAALSVAKKQDLDHAWYQVDNGHRQAAHEGIRYPFRAIAMCRATDLPVGASAMNWIELMHELVRVTGAPHALIWAGTDWRPIASRQFLTGVPRPQYPPDHPVYEIDRTRTHRAELGDRWIRSPAWGSYLKPEHVDAIGGRAKIVEIVRPDVVRDVGALVYFQLSERIEDAVTAETERKRRAFEELAAPVTVPRS